MSANQVAMLMGGERVLGRRVTTSLGMADVVGKGLPEKALERIKEQLALTDAEMAATLGMSPKTIGRLRSGRAPLPSVTSDRLYRLARIYTLARDVFEHDDPAREWLKLPQIGLGNRVPLELMTTEAGAREVEDLLGRIEYGVLFLKKAWRIVKTKHAAGAFTGDGARDFGGRWNHRGTAVVYLSDSLALAALELFVHVGKAGSGLSLVAFEVALPDGAVEQLPDARLPSSWRDEPPSDATKDLGTTWARGGASVALRVPSAIVPVEGNYLFNPAHPDAGQLRREPAVPFSFDPRMWG